MWVQITAVISELNFSCKGIASWTGIPSLDGEFLQPIIVITCPLLEYKSLRNQEQQQKILPCFCHANQVQNLVDQNVRNFLPVGFVHDQPYKNSSNEIGPKELWFQTKNVCSKSHIICNTLFVLATPPHNFRVKEFRYRKHITGGEMYEYQQPQLL